MSKRAYKKMLQEKGVFALPTKVVKNIDGTETQLYRIFPKKRKM